MKIGILGGTFNPPHVGHFILAQEIQRKAGLDMVLFVPTNIPPHKESHNVSGVHRIKMLKLAIGDDRHFGVSDAEIKRGGISYTVDTVRHLKSLYPRQTLYLIIGSDLANSFEAWRYHDEIKKEVRIIVGRRSRHPLRKASGFRGVNITHIGVSSSQIRALIKRKFSIKYLVPEKVREYIEKNKLYK
jgi:nicotinate-nucleotide adenylyltransferase